MDSIFGMVVAFCVFVSKEGDPMLVLSRKAGEEIIIGQDIVVHFVRVIGNRVRVAIDAPVDVHIRRGELPYSTEEWDLENRDKREIMLTDQPAAQNQSHRDNSATPKEGE